VYARATTSEATRDARHRWRTVDGLPIERATTFHDALLARTHRLLCVRRATASCEMLRLPLLCALAVIVCPHATIAATSPSAIDPAAVADTNILHADTPLIERMASPFIDRDSLRTVDTPLYREYELKGLQVREEHAAWGSDHGAREGGRSRVGS
jgi:hypothetical protein